MGRPKPRYVVRPDGGRFVVWDTVAKAAAVNGWRFGMRQYADDTARLLNANPERER